jgi:hypothetical protein
MEGSWGGTIIFGADEGKRGRKGREREGWGRKGYGFGEGKAL